MERDVVHKRDLWVTANDGSISGSASNGRLYFRPLARSCSLTVNSAVLPVEKCGPTRAPIILIPFADETGAPLNWPGRKR
jgi:hypothetical protein